MYEFCPSDNLFIGIKNRPSRHSQQILTPSVVQWTVLEHENGFLIKRYLEQLVTVELLLLWSHVSLFHESKKLFETLRKQISFSFSYEIQVQSWTKFSFRNKKMSNYREVSRNRRYLNFAKRDFFCLFLNIFCLFVATNNWLESCAPIGNVKKKVM